MFRKLLFLLTILAAPASAEAPRPNVLFILTDDMGWGDLGVFWQDERPGSRKFDTPALDRLATGGMQLRRHYCPAPVCAPSRASLLSGVHQGHSNVRDNQFDKALADDHTLGTLMRGAGYATAMIGKYGLPGGSGAPAHPEHRGFDDFFGYLRHIEAHYHYPADTSRNGSPVPFYDGSSNITGELGKCYSTDLLTARAKKWIADHEGDAPDQPFFLFLSYAAPHAGLRVPTDSHLGATSNYPAGGGLDGGVQWQGTPGAMINTAAGNIDSGIHPDYAAEDWPEHAKRHATMIRRIDDAVADLDRLLEDLGLDDDTLVVFTSDNGTHNEGGADNVGVYNPTFFDTFGPFEGIKRDCWEGGIRMPTLARWPSGIGAGGLTRSPSQFQDWMPTFAELAGVPAPARTDGVSLAPTLTGAGEQRESNVYIEYSVGGSTPNYTEFPNHGGAGRGQGQVVFLDGYKGVRSGISSHADPFEIYETEEDREEATDLAGTSPYFTELGQRMRDRVLQVRRAGGGASRPYDGVPVPAAPPENTEPGLAWRAFEGAFPWVPDFEPMTAADSGHATGIDLGARTRDNNIGLAFNGYLDVPAEGDYEFLLTTDAKAFVRLHDAALIDADRRYEGGEVSSGSIPLEAGPHPVTIYYARGNGGAPSLELEWSGPGLPREPVPDDAWLSELVLPPGPPQAGDDGPVTVTTGGSVLVDVLANDLDDGTPGPLSLEAVTQPVHGEAVIEGDQARYLSDGGGFIGTDTFIYTVSDGADSDTGVVTLEVVAQQPPQPADDESSTTGDVSGEGTAVVIDVLANDADPDGGPTTLGVAEVGTPDHGSAVIDGGAIRYTPAAGFFGEDAFSYTVSDGADTATAVVTVEVHAAAEFLWLPFDESSGTVARAAGGRPVGALEGFAADDPWIEGEHCGAIETDGAGAEVSVDPAEYTPPLGAAPRTFAAWLKPEPNQPEFAAWLSYGENASGRRMTLRVDGGRLRCEVQGGYAIGTATLDDGDWHHVAVVVNDADGDGSPNVDEVGFFVDGAADPVSESVSRDIGTIDGPGLTIGGSGHSEAYHFAGGIDDLRIYAEALSAGGIAELAGDDACASAWFLRHLGGLDPSPAAWSTDGDGDGWSVFAEFALGGGPHGPDPDMAPRVVSAAGDFDFIFNRRRGLESGRYVVETSTDLDQGWTPLSGGSAREHPDLPRFERVAVVLETEGEPRRFVRLRVE